MFASIFGLVVGLIQGYLVVPGATLALAFGREAAKPWGHSDLPVAQGIALVMALALFAIAEVTIPTAFEAAIHPSRALGEGWVGGVFFGFCLYAFIPTVERAIRARRARGRRRPPPHDE